RARGHLPRAAAISTIAPRVVHLEEMKEWTRPSATEIKMDAEISSYQGDDEFDDETFPVRFRGARGDRAAAQPADHRLGGAPGRVGAGPWPDEARAEVLQRRLPLHLGLP